MKRVVADGVTSQNFRDWSAEAISDRLLGSAKPGHIKPSDWSAAKKTDDGYQGKRWSCWILSGLTTCVRDRPRFTVFRLKIEQNSCMLHCQTRCHYWRFMQIRQRIFYCTEIQSKNFILDKILKLLTYHTPHHSCLDSPPHPLINSSLSSSPLSSSITPSLFHSKLKTYLFNKSFPP